MGSNIQVGNVEIESIGCRNQETPLDIVDNIIKLERNCNAVEQIMRG